MAESRLGKVERGVVGFNFTLFLAKKGKTKMPEVLPEFVGLQGSS